MKKLVFTVALALSAVYLIAYIVFRSMCGDNSAKPHLITATFGIIVGLATFLFYRFSPQLQRRAKLVILGSGVSLTVLASVFVFNDDMDYGSGGLPDLFAILSIEATMCFLFIEFCQAFRKREL